TVTIFVSLPLVETLPSLKIVPTGGSFESEDTPTIISSLSETYQLPYFKSVLVVLETYSLTVLTSPLSTRTSTISITSLVEEREEDKEIGLSMTMLAVNIA